RNAPRARPGAERDRVDRGIPLRAGGHDGCRLALAPGAPHHGSGGCSGRRRSRGSDETGRRPDSIRRARERSADASDAPERATEMARTFLLQGSGEFEPWTADVERRALAGAVGDGSVAILPTASAPEGDEGCD